MNNSSRQKEAVLNVFAAPALALMRLGLDQAFVPVRSRIAGWAEVIARAGQPPARARQHNAPVFSFPLLTLQEPEPTNAPVVADRNN